MDPKVYSPKIYASVSARKFKRKGGGREEEVDITTKGFFLSVAKDLASH